MRALLLAISLTCAVPALAQNYARYSDIQAGMHDPILEHQAVMAANKRAAAIRCPESFEDAKITSSEWEIVRHENGMIVGRYLHIELFGRTDRGRCGAAHCVFRQKMRGDNTYAPRLTLVEMGPFYRMRCED